MIIEEETLEDMVRTKIVLLGTCTFWHFANIVFVEKLACLAFLAEALEPVLADDAASTGKAAVFVDVLVRFAKVEI